MKKLLSAVMMSISSLVVGYGALVIPFRIFDELSRNGMRILFAAEIIIYLAILAVVFMIKESKKNEIKKERNLKKRHNERVLERQKAISGIKVYEYEIAA